jgi:hypothetical protein
LFWVDLRCIYPTYLAWLVSGSLLPLLRLGIVRALRKRLLHVQGLPPVLFLFPILPPTTSFLALLLSSPPFFSLVTIYPSSHNANTTPQTFSLTTANVTQHLISYYKIANVESGRLRAPSSLPELASLGIAPALLEMANFR